MTHRLLLTTFFTLAGLAISAMSAQAQGLVWHLPLNDGAAGTTVTSTGGATATIDDLGHGATSGTVAGSNPGGALWANDANRGIVFSTGDNNRLNAGTQDINPGNLYAWSVWVNTTEPIGPGTIMGNRQGGNTWSKLQVERLNANGATNVPFTPINDGAWHHLLITGTSATNISAYVDGVFSGQDNSIGTIPTTALLHVGGNPSFAPSEDFTGLLSDAAIWDESLSAEEAQGLFDVTDHAGGLFYDAGEFDLLKQLHDAGAPGTVDIDGTMWEFVSSGLATGLTPDGNGGFALGLAPAGGSGSGVQTASAAVPEPASVAIWSLIGLGLVGFGFYRNRRKK